MTGETLTAGDRFGPERVVTLRRPEAGLDAVQGVEVEPARCHGGTARVGNRDDHRAARRKVSRGVPADRAVALHRHARAHEVEAAAPREAVLDVPCEI